MTLTDRLASDLVSWLDTSPDGATRRVLLWPDANSEFARLVAHLAPALAQKGIRLLVLDPSTGRGQLGLKLDLILSETDTQVRTVVYLPSFGRSALEARTDGAPPDLWALYEYRFKGCVFGRGEHWSPGDLPEPLALLAWLTSTGVTVAEDARAILTAGSRDSLLSRYAELQRSTSPSDWPHPLRLDDVQDSLAGDPRDSLRRLIAAPKNEVHRWGDERELVTAGLAAEYGFGLPDKNASPEALADACVIQLALAEAWDALGRAADFPFLSRLPADSTRRERLAGFVRDDVIGHAELGPRFHARVRRLEPKYDLREWASGRVGRPQGLPLLALARWRSFLDRLSLSLSSGWKAARDSILGERADVVAAADDPTERLAMAGSAPETHWSVAADLVELLDAAHQAVIEAPALATAADLFAAYTARWWRADRAHLRVRAACSRSAGLEALRRLADLAYLDYAACVSDRLAALVETEGHWPPSNTIGVGAIGSTIWASGVGRQAVLVCDALRWDLAESLRERLSEADCVLRPCVSTLPSVTEFGMAALLPLSGLPDVSPSGGKVSISQDGGPNLATRDGRREHLRSHLKGADGKARVDFIELEAMLKGDAVPATPMVVVFDNNLDEQGHKGAEELPVLAEHLVENLRRGIELLQDAGVTRVHIVTDHGFLLLPTAEVDTLGTPSVQLSQAFVRDARYALLKPDAPAGDVLRLPLPLAPQMVLGLPRGVRTLVKTPAYLHGGLSPQECVIPHLIVTSTFQPARLGAEVHVRSPRLSSGTIPVMLRPVPPAGQMALGGVAPLTARLTLETLPTANKSARTAAEATEVNVKLDSDTRASVFISEGLGLVAGQELVLRATDVETGGSLGAVVLTLLVDWE